MADYWGVLYPLSIKSVRHYNSLIEARKDLMDWMMYSRTNGPYIVAYIWEQKTKPKSFDGEKYQLKFTGYVKDRSSLIQRYSKENRSYQYVKPNGKLHVRRY